jgi:hypothetical protein
MAKLNRSDHAKVTVWTPSMKSDFSGGRSSCCIQMFMYVDTENMGAVLEKMHEIYEKRQEHINEREKDKKSALSTNQPA